MESVDWTLRVEELLGQLNVTSRLRGCVMPFFCASELWFCAIKQGFPVLIRKQSVCAKLPSFIVSTGAFVFRFQLARSDHVSGETQSNRKKCKAALKANAANLTISREQSFLFSLQWNYSNQWNNKTNQKKERKRLRCWIFESGGRVWSFKTDMEQQVCRGTKPSGLTINSICCRDLFQILTWISLEKLNVSV